MLHRSLRLLAKDPFRVLGLTRSATKAEVKSRFRELARAHHPDAAHGDSKKMEEINRAYNLLLKEGAFERLHLTSKPRHSGPTVADADSRGDFASASGGTTAGSSEADNGPTDLFKRKPPPFAQHAENIVEDEDYRRVSALNAETERVTPEGKFMYQNRDTGEWVTLDQPLTRGHVPRYRSFAADASKSETLAEELRRRNDHQQRLHHSRSQFQKIADRMNDHGYSVGKNRYALFAAAAVFLVSGKFSVDKGLAWRAKRRMKEAFYVEIDSDRVQGERLYSERQVDVEIAVAAAALVLLAAARKKSLSDPVVGSLPPDHYDSIRPPKAHFEIVSSN